MWASQAFGWDALTALAVAGAQLPGIELGTAVVPVPQRHPLVLAGAPAMLRLAGELADGTVTRMTGPRTLADHIVPSITKAAQASGRSSPRVVAGALVSVTDDEQGVRGWAAEQFGLAGQVPEYRAVLDREGADGPQDVVIAGDEVQVERQLRRLQDAGVTDFVAAPFGRPDEQDRTIEVIAALAQTKHHQS